MLKVNNETVGLNLSLSFSIGVFEVDSIWNTMMSN
jgi:hypothetical protein